MSNTNLGDSFEFEDEADSDTSEYEQETMTESPDLPVENPPKVPGV